MAPSQLRCVQLKRCKRVRTIIDFLIARAIRPENTCRVRWEQGTLTLWANPFVMHTAINDYASYRRVTYRSTVEGLVPQAAPAAEAQVDRAARTA